MQILERCELINSTISVWKTILNFRFPHLLSSWKLLYHYLGTEGGLSPMTQKNKQVEIRFYSLKKTVKNTVVLACLKIINRIRLWCLSNYPPFVSLWSICPSVYSKFSNAFYGIFIVMKLVADPELEMSHQLMSQNVWNSLHATPRW